MSKIVIVVGHTETDEWGNLNVTDKEGNVHRVAKKREKLHPLFQQGVAVELDYQTYMNRDYVANAELVSGKVDELEPSPEDDREEPDKALSPKSTSAPRSRESHDSSPEIGMCIKEIGELIRQDKLSGIYGVANAVEIVKWYRGYLSATLKFPCDGKLLPKFSKPIDKPELDV